MKILNRMICLILGHKRGRRVETTTERLVFRCPRCGVEWGRKVKVQKVKA